MPEALVGNRLNRALTSHKMQSDFVSGVTRIYRARVRNGTPRKTKRRINAPRSMITLATCRSSYGGLTAREARKTKCPEVSSHVNSTRPSDFPDVSL
ncbi:unnamed protein product [Prunus armeniaca]